jgi:uncharacterized short protein YbdD (DUF466 family)
METRVLDSSRTNMFRRAWSWLRQVSGDAAYDNYLRCAQRTRNAQEALPVAANGSAPPLSRAEFYLDSLRRRYSTVSRCC